MPMNIREEKFQILKTEFFVEGIRVKKEPRVPGLWTCQVFFLDCRERIHPSMETINFPLLSEKENHQLTIIEFGMIDNPELNHPFDIFQPNEENSKQTLYEQLVDSDLDNRIIRLILKDDKTTFRFACAVNDWCNSAIEESLTKEND